MGRARTIARRTFLIGSAAIAGGVAFGVYAVRTPHDNPLRQSLAPGEATFNPFVKITGDAIVLILPHADVGQGVQSLQAALIAEELDVDPAHVTLSFGQPDAAYYNTALAADLAPFMPFDDSRMAKTVRSALGGAAKVMGIMATGGSSSVPDSYDKLRHAGAVARETLKRAAADQTGHDVTSLRTQGGAVILPDGATLPYTALAATAARVEPVTEVSLRDPSEWRLLGKPMQRTDIISKSTGTQTYGIDLRLEGMVHAALCTNPRQGGAMLGYDAGDAKKMRGVIDVVPITGGVAVVADNTWRAFQAIEAIRFDWGPAPFPAEMQGHWDAVAASFIEDNLDKTWRDEGDVGAVLAAETLSAEYRSPYVAHQPLEPLSAVVRISDGGAEVWAAHQLPRFLQDKVAAVAGCAPEDVLFYNQFAGGSFGHRLEFDFITRTAEIAVQMKGTPVKLTYRREEDFIHDYPRQIGMARAQGKVKEGKVEAFALDIATPSVAASQASRLGQPIMGPDGQIVAGAWTMPYAIPHLRVRGFRTPELAPVSSWRAVGAPVAGFFAESWLDELIHAAGADPLAERLRLCTNPVHMKVLEAVAEMSNWGGSAMSAGQGRGVAMVESFGVPVAEVVEVTQTPEGIRIDKVFVAADVGRVLDPVNFENNVQGGVIWGLGHAINAEITFSDGVAEQDNFYTHEGLRFHQAPEITVRGLENGPSVRGIGEPPVPPAAPALANAIFAATGQRLREMPFNKFIDFA